MLGRTLVSAISHNFASGPVTLGVDEAILATQIGLHHHLDALDAASLVVEKAKSMPEPFLIGVESLRFGFADHAAQPRTGQFLLELGHAHGVHPALHDDVGPIRSDPGRDFFGR